MFSPNQISVLFEKMNFYSINTTNVSMYGIIAVYGNIALFV